MKGRLDKRIQFQILDESEEWTDYYSCLANINTLKGEEYFGASAEQSTSHTLFTVRYCKKLADMYLDTQSYRIKFNNGIFDIQNVDDFMFQHLELKIKAVGRLERRN